MKYLLMIAMLFALALQAQTLPAGSGTELDPYRIESLDNLLWISGNSSSWSSFYVQTADIDASSTSTWNGGEGWYSIGNSGTPFTGIYDGGGFNVSGLFINRPSINFIGFFGYISNAAVKRLNLTGLSISGNQKVGGIAGYMSSSKILKCSAQGSITGSRETGGIAGWHITSVINNCSYSGTVSGSTYYIGGLVGKVSGGEISYSSSSGSLTGSCSYSGGLIGGNESSAKVSGCFSTVSVNVTGSTIGGLIGYNSANVYNCFSTGSVSGSGTLGGLMGTNLSTVKNSFWDIQSSGMATSAAGTGKTTPEMKNPATFTSVLWDLDHIFEIDGNTNSGYPFIRELSFYEKGPVPLAPSFGDGSVSDPYQISSVANLSWMTADETRWDYNYIQTEDIYLNEQWTWYLGKGWAPLGRTYKFTGTYDGQEHIIDGLYINDITSEYLGFIGSTQAAVVSNLGITNANITGRSRIGALVGYNNESSTVTNCFTTGSVKAAEGYVGGFVGHNYYYSTITRSYSSCSVVSLSGYAGGFAGYTNSDAYITNCYSTGPVTSNADYSGGFIGRCDALTRKCYATGYVSYNGYFSGGLSGGGSSSTLVESFWDIETTGKTTTFGAVSAFGKTTAQMKSEATFTSVWPGNWDFEGETANGTEDIWDIDGITNNGYPFFFKFIPTYDLTVVSNDPLMGSATDLTDAGPYEEGSLISFSASPEAGCFFNGWTSDSGGSFSEPDSLETTFTMPASSVTVTANFVTKYTVTVSSDDPLQGTAADLTSEGPYFEGTYITISAAPETDHIFKYWESTSGSITDPLSAITTFCVPSEDAAITAYFEPEFAGGSGTELDPYLISDEYQLNNVRTYADSSYTDIYFLQTANIDLSAFPNWVPIGNIGTDFDQAFRATYDGGGFNISGLNIDRPSENCLGLFGIVKNGSVKNVNIVNASVNGDSDWTGILAGYNYGGTISGCHTGGTIISTYGNAGGLIGQNLEGNVSDCSSSAAVSGDFSTGGLIGFNRNGTVNNCSASGEVISTGMNVGGLVGQNDMNSSIEFSFASGNVSGRGLVGGFVGINSSSGTINECYTTGNVVSTGTGGLGIRTGGFAGENFDAEITNSYSTGTVTGSDDYTGGFAGYNYQQDLSSLIDNCYSNGSVSGSGITGGFCAYNNSTITDCFWDTELSGLLSSSGGSAGTTAEMNSYSTFEPAGWDFKYLTSDGTEDIWYIDTINNSKYPWLAWQNLPLQPATSYAISSTQSSATLSWDGALGATYDVYSSDDPNKIFPDEWYLETSGVTDPDWVDNNISSVRGKFYRTVVVYPY